MWCGLKQLSRLASSWVNKTFHVWFFCLPPIFATKSLKKGYLCQIQNCSLLKGIEWINNLVLTWPNQEKVSLHFPNISNLKYICIYLSDYSYPVFFCCSSARKLGQVECSIRQKQSFESIADKIWWHCRMNSYDLII